jgi:hypothetical protein
MKVTIEINGQTFQLDTDPKKGDFVLLDWAGEMKEDDLRWGKCVQVSTKSITLENQYGNLSHAHKESISWPNAKWYKLTLL